VNIVADESVDRQVVERLRNKGHVVEYVAEVNPGIADEAVLELSYRRQAILLTADKDFGDLVFSQRLLHSGVFLYRLAGLAPELKAEKVAAALDFHGEEMASNFTVLSERTLRIRRRASS